jgi:Domain of unknown function (DUF4333)
MTPRYGACLGAAVLVGAVALQLTGCSATVKTNTVRPERAAQAVTELVSQKTGFNPTDVTCPSGVEAKVGVEFQCHFTGPEGPYTADVKITKVNGEDLEWDIKTHRS